MAKFYGKVGYAETTKTAPGVWVDQITEHTYFGDVLSGSTRWVNADGLNDDLKITTRISIMADAFANEHFSKIKYCEWMGTKWKVVEINPQRPRLILTLGGEYNGEQA